jgi:hypothetical protein
MPPTEDKWAKVLDHDQVKSKILHAPKQGINLPSNNLLKNPSAWFRLGWVKAQNYKEK